MEIHELHQVYEIRTKPGRQFYRIFEIRDAHETAVVEGFGGCIGAVFCQVVGGKAEEVHNPRTKEGGNVSHLSRKSQKVALFLFSKKKIPTREKSILSEGFEVVSLNEVFGMGRHGHHKDGSSLLLHFLLRLPLGRLRRLGDLPSGGGGRRGRLRGGEDA